MCDSANFFQLKFIGNFIGQPNCIKRSCWCQFTPNEQNFQKIWGIVIQFHECFRATAWHGFLRLIKQKDNCTPWDFEAPNDWLKFHSELWRWSENRRSLSRTKEVDKQFLSCNSVEKLKGKDGWDLIPITKNLCSH